MRRSWRAVAVLAAPLLLASTPARAASPEEPRVVVAPVGAESPDEAPRAVFALIIGVNASPGPDVAPLQYADDDAARYLDLFRVLGARTYLLSRLDENTRRLHPQAAAEALLPRRAELRQVVESLARDIGQARARGVPSSLYVIYAGHGDVQNSGLYLTLEGDRLSGHDLLAEVVERAGADQTHVIVDACHAYLLALPRGRGGVRRPAVGFVELEAASRAGRIGYLLSSSVSGESHEWTGFESGVFSHEVRSGLYGAADADGDGQVTYSEIGAFVARANQAIVNERFRPRVLARAPRGGDLLLDLRPGLVRGLRLEGPEADAHYLLEDAVGNRLFDFHGSATAAVNLVRPPGTGPLYLRRVADGTEWAVPRVDGVVRLDELTRSPPRTQTRGAAHHAFSQTFTLAFDESIVKEWSQANAELQLRLAAADQAREREAEQVRRRRLVGIVVLGVGAAAAVAATAVEVSASWLHDDASVLESQRDAVERNVSIATRNKWATGLAIGAAGAGVTAAVLLLWPKSSASTFVPSLEIALSPDGGGIGARGHF